MPYEVYKVLHILGVMLLFVALGGAAMHGINGGTKEDNAGRGLVAASHGSALVIILVAGFGLLAKLGMASSMPLWVILKLVIWLLMGGVLVILNKQPKAAKALWFALPVLGALAAYLAVTKPGGAAPATGGDATEESEEAE